MIDLPQAASKMDSEDDEAEAEGQESYDEISEEDDE